MKKAKKKQTEPKSELCKPSLTLAYNDNHVVVLMNEGYQSDE